MPISDSDTGGFTLLEVVVALAIAALALIVLFRSGSDGLFAVATASHAEQAVERARSHLAAVGRDIALVSGTTEGSDGGGYRWRLSVKPVAHWETPPANSRAAIVTTLFDVEVAISWPGHAKRRAVVLRTRRLGTETVLP